MSGQPYHPHHRPGPRVHPDTYLECQEFGRGHYPHQDSHLRLRNHPCLRDGPGSYLPHRENHRRHGPESNLGSHQHLRPRQSLLVPSDIGQRYRESITVRILVFGTTVAISITVKVFWLIWTSVQCV